MKRESSLSAFISMIEVKAARFGISLEMLESWGALAKHEFVQTNLAYMAVKYSNETIQQCIESSVQTLDFRMVQMSNELTSIKRKYVELESSYRQTQGQLTGVQTTLDQILAMVSGMSGNEQVLQTGTGTITTATTAVPTPTTPVPTPTTAVTTPTNSTAEPTATPTLFPAQLMVLKAKPFAEAVHIFFSERVRQSVVIHEGEAGFVSRKSVMYMYNRSVELSATFVNIPDGPADGNQLSAWRSANLPLINSECNFILSALGLSGKTNEKPYFIYEVVAKMKKYFSKANRALRNAQIEP